MNPLLIAGALVAVILLAWFWWYTRAAAPAPSTGSRSTGKQPFVDTVTGWAPRATRVLSKSEIAAFDTLRAAFPAHLILAQVPLARFIKVPTRNSYAEWLRRAGQLCADLVVCDRYSQVIAVVELRFTVDAPNERALRRQKRLERVLSAAEIPVHFWSDDAIPSPDDARHAILPHAVDSDIEAGFEMPSSTTSTTSSTSKGPMPMNQAGASRGPQRERLDDDGAEMSDARPETWFDDLDTSPMPLAPTSPGDHKPR